MINLYIANLGKYNEGHLVGAWLNLPATEEQIATALKTAGINEIYEEYAIHDYEINCDLTFEISEYAGIGHLNNLAEQLETLSDWDLKVIQAVHEMTGDDIAEILENDNWNDHSIFQLDETGDDHENLGWAYVNEVYGDISELSTENLEYHFDMDGFSRDLHFDRDTICEDMDDEDRGYMESLTDTEFAEWYVDGLGDIAELGRECLERYFDYKGFGRDLSFDYYIASNNLAISNH